MILPYFSPKIDYFSFEMLMNVKSVIRLYDKTVHWKFIHYIGLRCDPALVTCYD